MTVTIRDDDGEVIDLSNRLNREQFVSEILTALEPSDESLSCDETPRGVTVTQGEKHGESKRVHLHDDASRQRAERFPG